MRKLLYALFLLAVPVLLMAQEPVREWTSQNGQTARAAFDVEHDTNPETVPLIRNGKRYNVPLNKLSQSDQDYVTQIRAARSQDDDEDFGLEEVDDEDVGLEEVQDDDENFGLEEVGADENARLENNNKAKRAIEIVPSGKRYALLIGVNKYASPVKSLQYCVKDMELLSEGFQKTGVPKENIILVTDASSLERRPTGGNIRRQIEAITTLMEPNDQLIVAFSGHGAMVDGKSYLCPSDTDLKDKNSLVSRDWVFEKLEKCKAKQKVFIIDACRNEIAINGGKAIGQARTLEDPIGADAHGFILIASCDKRQYSMEHPDLQHGVFTYFFAEGLSGAAADEGGYVSIIALYEYASSKTKMYVLRNFKQQQVPTFRQGGEMTDFCLAKVEAPSTESFKAGDRKVFKINGIEIAFRYCPPGKFMMGASQSEIDKILKSKLGNMNIPPEYLQQISQQIPQIKAYINNLIKSYSDLEKQHEVTLTKGFWMMETEVTVGMFKAFVAETGYKSVGNEIDSGAASLAASARRTYETGRMVPIEVKLSWNNPEFPQTDSHPVVYVSWDDAVAFCKWLSKKTGLKIQLPTEAQWEFACRAGTTSMPAGKLDEMAWIQDPMNFGRRSEDNAVDGWMQWSNFIATHPVGKKKANAWGLYDMYGNAGEWCQDWLDFYPSESVTDPTGPSNGENFPARQIAIMREQVTAMAGAMYGGGMDENMIAENMKSITSHVKPSRVIRTGCLPPEFRFGFAPKERTRYVGFRCMMEQSK